MKKYWPVFILILSCIVFSYNFTDRFDLPMHDEALYASGYTHFPGWSSFYPFLYQILHFFTGDKVLSFQTMLFLISFLLTPAICFVFAKKIRFSIVQSILFATIGLLSPWNFPAEPKLQLVNFLFLMTAFIVRNPKKLFIFYGFMTSSLFFRTDNVIILLFFLLYDSYHFIRNRRIEQLLKALVLPTVIFLGLSLIWLPPFSSSRNYYAFQDHFTWRNDQFLKSNVYQAGKSSYDLTYQFFGGKPSLVNAIKTKPKETLDHFSKNLEDFVPAIDSGFRLLTSLSSYLIFLILLIIFIFNKNESENEDKETTRSFYLFTIGIFVKCFITSIILQPWMKYNFEFGFLLLVLVGHLIINKIPVFPRPRPAMILLLLPLVFYFDIHSKVFSIDVNLYEAIKTVKQYSMESKFRFGVSNTGLSIWYPNNKFTNVAVIREYDDHIHGRLQAFLDKHQFDIVALEPDFRRLNVSGKTNTDWTHFEENFNSYGFCLIKGAPLEGLSIYARQNPCPSLQVTN